jgi:hypothetical protein
MQDSIHQQNEELKLLRKYIASLETRITILLEGLDNVYKETHKARLAFIEPIAKEDCKHEPIESVMIGHICMYCGVKLQATWTEKK